MLHGITTDSRSKLDGITTDSRPKLNINPVYGIPQGMRELPKWMGTRLVHKENGKIDKPPYRVRRGTRITVADKTDPDNWATFEEAVEALRAGLVDAIGFVLTDDDPFVVVDYDNARDPKGSTTSPEARKITEDLDSYTEVSCSGRGLHIVALGKKKDGKCRKGKVEVYDRSRFMVMTGNRLDATPPEPQPRQGEIDALVAEYLAPASPRDERACGSKASRTKATGASTLDDAELLYKARNAGGGNGERFRKLYDTGDWSGFGSQSEADHALCGTLAFWTNHDAEAVDRLFRASALYRKKWDRRSYREPTIAAAMRSQRSAYTGRPERDGGKVRGEVARLRTRSRALAFPGRRGPSKWAAYSAAIDYAEEFGHPHKDGIAVELPERTAALRAGLSERTARNALEELCEEKQLMRRIRRGKRGTQAGKYVLLCGSSSPDKEPPSKVRNERDICVTHCVPWSDSLSAKIRQIRNAAPFFTKEYDCNGRKLYQGVGYLLQRLGKPAALALDRIAARPKGVTISDLAHGLNRRPDNVRKHVKKLTASGLVLEGERGLLTVPVDLEALVDKELEVSGCNDAKERAVRRYAEDRAAYKEYRAGRYPADDAPTEEDMKEQREARMRASLAVMRDAKTGPGMLTRTYLRGETKTFEYIVNSVATYYHSGPEAWRKPVEAAFLLITDGVPMPAKGAV